MKKTVFKIISLLLIIFLCVFTIPSFAYAKNPKILDSGQCGKDITWHLTTSADGLRLTLDGSGEMTDYMEYEYLDLDMEYPLAAWDTYKDDITEVVINDGITHIGGAAFYNESHIRSVSLPKSLKSIGDYAFAGCSGLEQIKLPETLESIGYYAFNGSGLTSLSISSNVSTINNFAFESCKNLTDLHFNEGFTALDSSVFCNCTSLVEVVLPEGMVSVGQWTFSGCTALEKIVIPSSVTEIGGINTDRVFNFCKKLKIYGYYDSFAQSYAEKYQIPFVCLDDYPIGLKELLLNETDLTLVSNELFQLEALFDTDHITNANLVWKSSNPTVANVDQNGLVYALSYGSAVITVKSADNAKVKATCRVNTLFNDVADSSQYYYKPVYWAAKNKYVGGFEGGVYFGPDRGCTRKQMAIILWKLAGQPKVNGKLPFSDTNYRKNSASYKAILWAYNMGIIGGYKNGTFKPNAPVTRKQAILMLYRYAGAPDVSGLVDFIDVGGKLESASYKAILWGAQKGIANGSNGKFKPGNRCSRKQIVTFIYKYCKKNTCP